MCRIYQPPIRALYRWWRPDEAEDLTQGLFVKLFEPRVLVGFKPERGKFRNWLYKTAKNHLIDEAKKDRAQKRYPGSPLASIDASAEEGYSLEPVDGIHPERIFERSLAITLLEQALEGLREHYEKEDGEAPLFDKLLPCLIGTDDEEHQHIAKELGMKANTFTKHLSRCRERFHTSFKEVIALTVSTDEIDEEIQFIFHVLRSRR
jgi:RNA polymerase sigma-70 factor (ECF subfamily)